MDYYNISIKGRFRLAEWIGKRHRKLRIAELIRSSRDERQLFKMCRYIDRWYDEHEGPVVKAKKPSAMKVTVKTVTEPPNKAPTYEVPEKHTRLKQHNFSRQTTHRLNEFITNNPEVGITKMLSEAATEDDLMRAMDEVETRKKVIDIQVKMWTVRRLS